jgi:hypothetical protein
VSWNDGTDKNQSMIIFSGPGVTDAQVYNNTFYVSPGESNKVIECYSWEGYTTGAEIKNNIFHVDGYSEMLWKTSDKNAHIYEGNVFYGNILDDAGNPLPTDPYAQYTDPKLANPGAGGNFLTNLLTDTVGADWSVFNGYQLAPDSPCIDTARTISNCGDRDIIGTAVPLDAGPDRGAIEFFLDTDNDGLLDEVDDDDDNDGLLDVDEATYGTDPLLADTDGGGLSDGQEVGYGLDPLNPDDDASDGANVSQHLR